MQNNQNNNSNNSNGQQPNPNYPYTQGLDQDYNQTNDNFGDNQFPQEFYDSNNFQTQPQSVVTKPQGSWDSVADNQVKYDYQSANQPESFTTVKPVQDLPIQNDIKPNSSQDHLYAYPSLADNNDSSAEVHATNSVTKNPENFKSSETNVNQTSRSNIKTKSGVTGLMITVLILVSIISIAGSSVVAGLVSYYVTTDQVNKNNQKSSTVSEITTTRVTDEQSAIVDAVTIARESVVSVIISKTLPGGTRNRLSENQNSSSNSTPRSVQVGAGSGFIVSSKGYIVTNKHVVEDTTATYSVVLDNNTELPATVLGRDPLLDIAILKVEPGNNNLKAIKLGDSGNIKVGQTVIAIGNSLGEFSNSVSRGIISGLGRTILAASDTSDNVETLEGIIQTDASINPGNSGGPLLDINGLVVGVNVAKSTTGDNVAFSIPINDVKQILENVFTTGKLQRPYLGIQYLLLNKELAQEQNLSVDYGAYLFTGDASSTAITKDGPAAKAGLQDKDVILEINGTRISQDNDLRKVVQKSKVGETITLKILRGTKQLEVKITLEALEE